MANLNNALQQLRAGHSRAQLEVERLGQAISAIESLHGSGASRKGNQTEANNFGSFAPKNGAGAKGEMGTGSEWIAARGGSSENY